MSARKAVSIPAALIRGGTSKGLFFDAECLHVAFGSVLARREAFLARCLGSPDSSGMQMDGLAGAITSSSKVCLLSRSTKPKFDSDWDFGQVGIKDGVIDWNGSCGNLAAGV
jgi:2-methylaconitate cis-trans-isomerase PrpF